ncbi:MAG TPA: hypothetical protein VKN14_12720 [Flavobacteriaceae bacterium]|nr:hypothetical protein [Flavobacteriaceae bacterium]
MEHRIKFSITEARIDAKIHVLTSNKKEPMEILMHKSKRADLVFTGLKQGSDNYEKRAKVIDSIVSELKVVLTGSPCL